MGKHILILAAALGGVTAAEGAPVPSSPVAVTQGPAGAAPPLALPPRAGLRVRKRHGFFGPPLLAFALLGGSGAAVAGAASAGGGPASPQ